MKPEMQFAVPVLACHDVEEAIAFWVEKLGFSREWVWGEPVSDGGVQRDGVQVFFMANREIADRARDGEVMLFVRRIDTLYAEHRARGAPIESEIRDEPWNLREYSVRGPHGYRLRFAESLELQSRATG